MKNTIIDILQRQSLRLSLCALAMTFCTASYAQDEQDEATEESGFKAPQRRAVQEKNTLVSVSGVVVDDVTKQPVAGVRVQAC